MSAPQIPGTPDPSVHDDSRNSLPNMDEPHGGTVRTPASLTLAPVSTGDVEKQPRKESVSIIPPSLRKIEHVDPPEGIALQKSPISASLRALPADRKTYQLRALSRKTIIYQKRQVFVNVCCIALCPFLMVAIAGLLGILVTNLISNGLVVQDILYCSNMTDISSDAVVETPPSVVPGATNTVKHLSYFMPPLVLTGNRQKVGLRLSQCSVWIDKGYTLEPPYRPNPQISENVRRDTTFQPDIAGGFFGVKQLLAPFTLALKQTYPWAYLVDLAGVAGKKDKMDNVANVTSFYATGAELGREGLLGSIPTLYFANITKGSGVIPVVVSSFAPVPFYDRTFVTSKDASELDDILTERIRSVIKRLSQVSNKEEVAASKNITDPEALARQLTAKIDVAAIANDMPWGNLIISDVKISGSERTMEFTMQYGTDGRIASAGSYPSEGTRKAVQLAWLGNAMLRQTPFGLSQSSAPAPVTITHGFRLFPLLSSTALNLPIGSLIGRILYPFGVSFLLPIFVIALVREKEDRVLVMMKMSGLKTHVYYVTHYIHFYSLHVMATFVFIISGLIFQMDLFTKTDPGVYILLFFMWGHAQIALAFLFSCVFSKSRSALVVVFLLVLCGVIINLVMESMFTEGAPAGYLIYPPFAFYRALSLISTASVATGATAYRMSDLTGQDEVYRSIIYLLVETLVYLALSFYLTAVLPTEFGVRKPWHFIFTEPVKYYKERKASAQAGPRNGNEASRRDLPADVDRPINQIEVADEDDDVRAERDRVLKNLESPECALIMKRMRKVYGTGAKLAVKDVTLAVEPNMVFGLLGPNGAGKTTLISILTGLYEPSSGNATLAGYDISKEMDKVYRSIGVCPQHDILWDDLTCDEHLTFYARLKGIPPEEEYAAVQQSLQYVKLVPFADRRAKGLSGGEKRRLSIAISLIANPTVVFLDEPTTGLDPEVRRIVWDVINTAKVGRTIILTTHSMEEAEVLCSRIGIMAKGTLRCLGNQLRLKELYGSGFRLSFTAQAENMSGATAFVESLLPTTPDAWKKLDTFTTTASYEFRNTENGVIPRIFESLERGKTEHGVEDWSVSQTTLEEVFLRIVQEAEAEAD